MKPLTHQSNPIQKLSEHNKFALFLDMGLGKTFITLYSWYNNDTNDILIVCPASISNGWEEEAKKMGLENITIFNFNNVKKNSKQKSEIIINEVNKNTNRNIFIIPYQTSFRLGNNILKLHRKSLTIVFDESQKIKDKNSKQGKYAVLLSNRFDKTILLSGTPMSKGYEDFYNQLKVLKHDNPLIKTWTAFKENFLFFETKHNSRYTFDVIVGVKNKDKLISIIKEKALFMSLEDSGVKLPPQTEIEVKIENEQEILIAIKQKVYGDWKQTNTGSKMMSYQQMASFFVYGKHLDGTRKIEHFKNNNKKQTFSELVENTKDKLIVYYNFEEESVFIKEIAKLHKKTFGNFSSKNYEILKQEPEVLAIQYLAGSEGLNLQNYRRIIYYSPTTQGALFQQSKKRIHREGQKKSCFYYYLITKNSIEERILEKIKENEDYTQELFEKDYIKED